MNLKSKDLTNKVFYNLTALHVVDKPSTVNTKNRGTWWMCKCTCGKERIVCSTELNRGDTKSCGCMNKYYNSKKYKGVGLLAQSVYSHMQWGAKNINIMKNVFSEKEFINYCKLIVNKHCPYTERAKNNTELKK